MLIAPDLAATVAVIVDEGSLDGAARRLRITPSAVSQRLRALEGQLGRVLVVRAKPARATEAGAVVVRLARQYALLGHDAGVELGLEGPGRMHVPIAVNSDSLATWFLPALQPVLHAHDIALELHRDDQDHTAELLEAGTVTAAVTSQRDPIAGCVVTDLGSTVYHPVASPSFIERWFPAGSGLDALAAAPVVDYDRTDDLQTQWLEERGVDPTRPPRHYVPASEDYATAVRLGFGWGLLPPMQAQASLDAGRLVRLDGPRITVPLYWQQWNLRSPLLADIREAVVTAARAALEQD